MTYRKIISGEAGLWAAPLRAGLFGLAALYRLGVGLHNRRYDQPDSRRRVAVPVISVGNLTAGGTGKTPVVVDLVERLAQLGRTPAVVCRGYGADPGEPNDEQRLLAARCPSVVCIADADRVRGAERARQEYHADVVVLDDGFQHRRLARDLDIVLIDATCPFGYGHLLPRGLLREPVRQLRRARLIAITRADQVSAAEHDQLRDTLRRRAPHAQLVSCRHAVAGVERLDGTPAPGAPPQQRVALAAGVGHPAAFALTARSLGYEVVAQRWWPDHHRYGPHDAQELRRLADRPGVDIVLVTEKDAVKLRTLAGVPTDRLAVVRVRIAFLDGADTIVDEALRQVLARSPGGAVDPDGDITPAEPSS